jgi:hypothetical protein
MAAFIVLCAEMGIHKFYVDTPNKAFISYGFRDIWPKTDVRQR